MKFLTPTGGATDKAFGILTSPQHAYTGVPAGIKAGLPWAMDNNAFTQGFDPNSFFAWLDTLKPYQDKCLFVTAPDVLAGASETLELFETWAPKLRPWPVAFVAQDGQEDLPLPTQFDTLFVGGSTHWKESLGAIAVIKRAQALDKHIHIGRVNYKRRYQLFNVLSGSVSFTCDGTRPRFEGKNRTHRAWRGYMAQRPLLTI